MPAPAIPAIAGAVPEEDGTEHIGRRGHTVIGPPVGIVPGSVNGGEHRQQNHKEDHEGGHSHNDTKGTAVPITMIAIAGRGAIVGNIDLVQGRKEGEDPLTAVPRLEGGAQVLVQQAGDIRGGKAGKEVIPQGQIGVAGAGIHHQQGVPGGETDLIGQGIGIVVNGLPLGGGHCRHGDQALIPLVPVGVIEAQGVLHTGGEDVGLVPQPGPVGLDVQTAVQRLGGVGGGKICTSGGTHLADADGKGDDQQEDDHRHPAFFQHFHITLLSRGAPAASV